MIARRKRPVRLAFVRLDPGRPNVEDHIGIERRICRKNASRPTLYPDHNEEDGVATDHFLHIYLLSLLVKDNWRVYT